MGNSYISLKTNGFKDFEKIFKTIYTLPVHESSNIEIWENPKKIKNISDIELGTDNNNIIVRFNSNLDFLVFKSSKITINNIIKQIRGF